MRCADYALVRGYLCVIDEFKNKIFCIFKLSFILVMNVSKLIPKLCNWLYVCG